MQKPSKQSISGKYTTRKGDMVYLVKGTEGGKKAWLYVLVQKGNLPAFKHKMKTNFIDVRVFGKILFSGWGEEPPKAILMQVKQQYS